LPTRAKLEQIVDESDSHTEKRGDSRQRESGRADLLRDEEGMSRETIDEPEDEDRRPERDGDRETSGARDRTRMDAAAAGHVEHPEPASEDADQRRRERRQRERKQCGTRQ
jgi:hypothetical protein